MDDSRRLRQLQMPAALLVPSAYDGLIGLAGAANQLNRHLNEESDHASSERAVCPVV